MLNLSLNTRFPKLSVMYEEGYSHELTVTRGKEWGVGIVREFGKDMYTLLYFKWITSKNLLHSTGNSAQRYVAAWMGGEFGGEWIHVYVWLNPFAVHLKQSKLLISFTLI